MAPKGNPRGIRASSKNHSSCFTVKINVRSYSPRRKVTLSRSRSATRQTGGQWLRCCFRKLIQQVEESEGSFRLRQGHACIFNSLWSKNSLDRQTQSKSRCNLSVCSASITSEVVAAAEARVLSLFNDVGYAESTVITHFPKQTSFSLCEYDGNVARVPPGDWRSLTLLFSLNVQSRPATSTRELTPLSGLSETLNMCCMKHIFDYLLAERS